MAPAMQMGGPLERYRALTLSGKLEPDPAQERAAAALDALGRAIAGYHPGNGFFGFGRRPTPKGLYLFGDVGRGKSLLMDLFFSDAGLKPKRRIHFNAFMMETHARIHEWRNLSPRERKERPEFVRDAGDDPIAPIAKRILNEAALLCFDEFQVTDVADAMILGRLFEKLFAFGVVVVLTSNIEPDRLYENGLNRQLFLPFIALIKQRLDVLELNGPRDFRLDRMAGRKVYIEPLGREADAAMDDAWTRLAGDGPGKPAQIDVMGRLLNVPHAAKGVARFSFDALCRLPLGASDYLALARSYHTVMIDNIPRLSADERNEARRFTLLIDTLYDEKTMLVCSAAVPPQELYEEGDNSAAFKRTVSRLMEMQSADYLKLRPGTSRLTPPD